MINIRGINASYDTPVRFGSTYYNASDIWDKTLMAKKNINAYTPDGKVFASIKNGNAVGYVYSHNVLPTGELRWIFDMPSGSSSPWLSYYVIHDPSAFDINALKQQGVFDYKSSAEAEAEAKEESGKTAFEKFFEGLGKGVKKFGTAILISGAIYLTISLILKNKDK
jgi:hypothetical protein